MDIGDVLIRTVPTAHYRVLAKHTGIGWERLAEIVESSGAVAQFETGQLTSTTFPDALREVLSYPALGTAQVRNAWNAVVADVDPVVALVAAQLSDSRQLLLASNTNPFHWTVVRSRLAEAGIEAPACLSFALGIAKPDPAFFTALARTHRGRWRHGVYVDDRADNVAAAVQGGLHGWVHRDPAVTAQRLTDLLLD
jgi:FMN phosphatase YigB (HAD superfamily)